MAVDLIENELERLKREGLYRELRRVEGEQGPLLRLGGREVVNFCSNNYLGLANHPALRDAARRAVELYGCGSGASRLISGNMALHEELEEKIARLKGTEAALVLNSGFQANVGLISTLTGEGDLIFSDALNHASLIDGCRLSRARTIVYPHCDLNRLEEGLKKAGGDGCKLIVTETVYSMDGDIAPLEGIVGLAERYGAMVMVDEAHATGIFGPNGAGVVAEMGLTGRVSVQMGTLGKALGSFGAYAAGSRALRELLINRCRSFIYTTSLPPAVLASAAAAIDLVMQEPDRRLSLREKCSRFRSDLIRIGFSAGQSQSQIFPLIVGDSGTCMAMSERLLARGVFVQGIRPPTVPQGTSRLRLTLMATHTDEHLERGLDALRKTKLESKIW